MKLFFKFSALIFACVLTTLSCKEEVLTESNGDGPEVTVNSYDAAAYMGGSLNFNVSVSDANYSLSTLQADLYFDEDVVATQTIRTKDAGAYDGQLSVPFLANIPDGNATLVLTATNTALGQTVLDPIAIAVSRPVYSALTLVCEDGTEYSMLPDDTKHVYVATEYFPASVNATIKAPAVDEDSEELVWGWSNSEISLGSSTVIPFSNGVAGTYSISFNTLTFAGSPFVTLSINDVETTMSDANTYYAVLNLTQGGTVAIDGYAEGFADWNIDVDWLEEISDGNYKFLAVDGLYKVTIEIKNKFFRIEAMASSTETAVLNTNGTGAIWLIGDSTVGKPTMDNGASWSPENGGLCLSQIETKKFQITLTAGVNISTSAVNFKFFHQKTWGGEFGYANITTDSSIFYVDEDENGNIFMYEDVTLELGAVYKFVIDLNNATYSYDDSGNTVCNGAVLEIECVGQQEVETEDIAVNSVALEMATSTTYKANIELTQGAAFTIAGVDTAGWYFSPDYLNSDSGSLSFNAVSGLYEVTLNLATGYVNFHKLASDGSYATYSTGAIYLMGWGIGFPTISNQPGWDTSTAQPMAQVSEGVYQLTGTAQEENDTTLGGAFRTDYLGAKYFGQMAWGDEAGKINGVEGNTVVLTEAAALHLNLSDSYNIGYETSDTDKHLTAGKTYRLTVDLSKVSEGIETIDFVEVE